jgi:hypothetical protein
MSVPHHEGHEERLNHEGHEEELFTMKDMKKSCSP